MRNQAGILCMLVLFFSASPGQAASNHNLRSDAATAHRNWTGYWEQDSFQLDVSGEPVNLDNGYAVSKLWFADPPYNSEWEARYKDTPDPPQHVYCKWGFPTIMESPYTQFEWVITPEQVLFIPIVLTAMRQIFTDGRSHPDKNDLLSTPTGDSIGRWEGPVLVVDTIGRQAGRSQSTQRPSSLCRTNTLDK